MLNRAELIAKLKADAHANKVWDVIVIGGGATGLGAAVDAASRGYSVLLLESHDFAKGTSSRSTKLIHGGVRYLAQGRLPLVRKSLIERGHLVKNASHLVRPLPFVIPLYRWRDLPVFSLAMKFYDALSGSLSLGKSSCLGRSKTTRLLPTVNMVKLRGGVRYFDAQFDDARLALALMRTLFDQGGVALNYIPVCGLLKGDGKVLGVVAQDALSAETIEIKGKAIINATGVWVDEICKFDSAKDRPHLAPSQGVHVVVDSRFLPTEHAILIPRTPDGRVLFVIPWMGKTLIGTTDTPRIDAPLEPLPFQEEIDFILSTAAAYLDPAPTRADVRSVFVGLRPLVHEGEDKPTAELSREHVIEVSPSGLITITGGKWTTYRSMACEVVDRAASVAGLAPKPCVTASLLLHGAPTSKPAEEGDGSLDIDPYGTDLEQIRVMEGSRVLLHPALNLTEAHVRFFARYELAQTVEDVLARRSRALFLDARAAQLASPYVASILAKELGHDDRWIANQLSHFSALSDNYLLHGPSSKR